MIEHTTSRTLCWVLNPLSHNRNSYSIINCSLHAMRYIPITFIFNWKFVPFVAWRQGEGQSFLVFISNCLRSVLLHLSTKPTPLRPLPLSSPGQVRLHPLRTLAPSIHSNAQCRHLSVKGHIQMDPSFTPSPVNSLTSFNSNELYLPSTSIHSHSHH